MKAPLLLLLVVLALPMVVVSGNNFTSNSICFYTLSLKDEVEPVLKEFTLHALHMNIGEAAATFEDDDIVDRLHYIRRIAWPGHRVDPSVLLHAYELALGYEIAMKNILLDVALSNNKGKKRMMEKLSRIDALLRDLTGVLKEDKRVKNHPQRNEKTKLLSGYWDYAPVWSEFQMNIKLFVTLHYVEQGINELNNIFGC